MINVKPYPVSEDLEIQRKYKYNDFSINMKNSAIIMLNFQLAESVLTITHSWNWHLLQIKSHPKMYKY